MDCQGGSGSAGVPVIEFHSGNSGNGANENWGLGSINQAVWTAEDDLCKKETSPHTNSKSNHKERPFQFEVQSEPPNKRATNSLLVDLATSDRTEVIGKMLYKTKLCCKFRVGACPFIKNCNFAHGMEELRELPANWQRIVAGHKEQVEISEPREVFQIPVMESDEVMQGPNVRQHCKNFISEVGCRYGENCIFIHNEDYRDRKSVAICLLPGTGGGCESNGNKSNLHASNWKTRICNKWQVTGFCVYGSNCHFAHGFAELQHHGGGLANREAKDSSTFDTNQVAAPAKASAFAVDTPAISVPYSYQIGGQSRALPNVMQKIGEIPIRRWKGPNKISKIYGDWIDDLE